MLTKHGEVLLLVKDLWCHVKAKLTYPASVTHVTQGANRQIDKSVNWPFVTFTIWLFEA